MELSYDVIVAGGGMAGVAAAVAAAREGARVLLIERYGFLGGMATSALVNPFMAYCEKYGEGERFNWDRLANAGIFMEIIRRLEDFGALHRNRIAFNEEFLKIILDRLCKNSGVRVLFHTFVLGAETEGGRLEAVTAAGKGGIFRFTARAFVDATGDADVAALSGCPWEIGENGLCQPLTLTFRLGNVDTDRYAPAWGGYNGGYPDISEACAARIDELYRESQRDGKIKNPMGNVNTFASCLSRVIHFNSTRVFGAAPMDAEAFSDAEMEAREQMLELYRFMRGNAPGFEEAELLMSGHQIGVRESRRIIGDYILHENDILSCRKFEDSIARGTYCIDIHNKTPEDTSGGMTDLPYNDYYTIPYRCLLPQKIRNLIVAGRPISSTHTAHGSHRVLPICTCVGEAAGVAAGIAADRRIPFREVPVSDLQRRIRDNGGLY